jgi:hypothetical protein
MYQGYASFWFSRILPTVRQRFFEDSKSNHGIAEEKKEVCMAQEVHGSISKAQGVVDDSVNTEGPQHGHGFLACADTSKEGLGGVLMQDGQVIAYISRKLRMHEENYMTNDWELFSIMYAWRM